MLKHGSKRMHKLKHRHTSKHKSLHWHKPKRRSALKHRHKHNPRTVRASGRWPRRYSRVPLLPLPLPLLLAACRTANGRARSP